MVERLGRHYPILVTDRNGQDRSEITLYLGLRKGGGAGRGRELYLGLSSKPEPQKKERQLHPIGGAQ